jgi:hypothetical protein
MLNLLKEMRCGQHYDEMKKQEKVAALNAVMDEEQRVINERRAREDRQMEARRKEALSKGKVVRLGVKSSSNTARKDAMISDWEMETKRRQKMARLELLEVVEIDDSDSDYGDEELSVKVKPQPSKPAKNFGAGTRMVGNDGNTYGVGDYVEGLGNIEDIDQYGNPTILPDDPEKPAYRLGQSEVGPEGKAEEPEEAHMSGPARDYPSMGEFMAKMARISGLKPRSSYQGEKPEEEDALAWIKDNSRPIEPEEEELQHMIDNVYAGLTDDQVGDAVEKDYNTSTAIDGTYSSNEDGSWTQDYTRPDGKTITLKGYGEGEDEVATANVTGLYQ